VQEVPVVSSYAAMAQAVPPEAPQAQVPTRGQTTGQETLASQLQQLPLPLDSTAISQYLASYHTGHMNTAGRPMLAVGPWMKTQAFDSLPLLGEGSPGLRPHAVSCRLASGNC